MNTYPDYFVQIITAMWGEEGEAWLATLPDQIAEYERRWSIRVLPHFPNLSYNFVAPAVRADGTEAVLKFGLPHDEHLLDQIEALRLFNGRGCVKLLEEDRERAATLIERLNPGTPLTSIKDDEQSTRIIAQVMRGLWVPAPAETTLPGIETWSEGLVRLRQRFEGGTGPIPTHLVDLAESLSAELKASMGPRVVLHGDLHHENILLTGDDRWVAIDPHGLTGEAEVEVFSMLLNPLGVESWPNLKQVQARRIDVLSEMLGFDRQRMVRWGITQAVISAWWDIEDLGEMSERALTLAEAMLPLLRTE